MNEEKRILLERKRAMQDAKNRLKYIDGQGLEVLEIFEADKKPVLEEIFSEYCAAHYGTDVPADYKISVDVSQEQIYAWIVEKFELLEGKEYLLLCGGYGCGRVWKRLCAIIKIDNAFAAVKSMWIHGHGGFILVDMEDRKVLEAGNDSRDEKNYLIDIYIAKGRKYITQYYLKEINGLSHVFLYQLVDNDDRLYIELCSGTVYPTSRQMIEQLSKENNKMAEILKNSMKIIPDSSPTYRITFESYVGYNVRNESYVCADDSEVFISEYDQTSGSDRNYGNKFRLYTKSKYLEYLHENTFADQIEDYTHYAICCENQVIDVASCDIPIIEKL